MAVVSSLLLIGIVLSLNNWVREDLHKKNVESLTNLSNVFISNLIGEITKFSFLPNVVANDSMIIELLRNKENFNLVNAVNFKLEAIANFSNASDIFLMDPEGTTVSASNWSSEKSFIGKNYSFRPYFIDALKGIDGQFFAVGVTTKVRGYFFSAPVYDQRLTSITNENSLDIIGVMVVKINMDSLEKTWQDYEADILIIDEFGVVFSSNKVDWHYTQLNDIDQESTDQLTLIKKYPIELLKPIQFRSSSVTERGDLINVSGEGFDHNFLGLKNQVKQLGWEVYAMRDYDQINSNFWFRFLTLSTIALLSILLVNLLLIKRKNLLAHLEYRKLTEQKLLESNTQLEKRVALRTKALTEANEDLKIEITERERAELELRQAQEELLHAARLATLGQLSAGLSHELSQPLAAITAYAENAISFLDHGQNEQTQTNIEYILGLCAKINQITDQLKSHARKSSEKIEKVNLLEAIDNSLVLLSSLISNQDIITKVDIENSIHVKANLVRLEQVFVNLITNACHAMQEVTNPTLEISQKIKEDSILIYVKDNGKGISETELQNIFDPFFSTKSKTGLGLGLSISKGIINSIGGELTVESKPGSGACFTILLKMFHD